MVGLQLHFRHIILILQWIGSAVPCHSHSEKVCMSIDPIIVVRFQQEQKSVGSKINAPCIMFVLEYLCWMRIFSLRGLFFPFRFIQYYPQFRWLSVFPQFPQICIRLSDMQMDRPRDLGLLVSDSYVFVLRSIGPDLKSRIKLNS